MPINYRPTTFASHSAGGGDIAGTGPVGAGLSAGAENGLGASVEHNIGQAHQFFNAQQMHSMAANAMAAEVAVRPPVMQPTGLEASALHAAPMAPTGIEAQALLAPPPMDATPLAALAGANEPISPIIQLIMRLPGATGLMQSFFECLGQFFFGQLHLPSFLDPALFAQHAAGATANFRPGLIPGAEHLPINMSLLPQNAPIFQSLPFNFHGSLPFNHMASNMGSMAGHTGFSLSPEHFRGLTEGMNVSGKLDLGKPQFEWSSKFGGQGASQSQGELISGPHLSEGKLASHLSGTDRLFSDNAYQTGMVAHKLPLTSTPQVSQSLPIANQLPNSLNASGNTSLAGQTVQGSSTAGSLKDTVFNAQPTDTNAGFRLGQPQEGTLDLSTTSPQAGDMAADKVLASNQENFRPTLGGMEKPQGFDSSWSTPRSVAPLPKAGSTLGGLKAKQLTLDSLKTPAPAKPVVHDATRSPVMDSIGHPTKAAAHHHFGQAHDQVAHRNLPKAYHKPSQPAHIRHESQPVESNVGQDVKTNAQYQQTDASQAQPVDQTQGGTDQVVAGDQPVQPTSYTIRSGDCLWNIAKNQMGDALRWKEIYSMNQNVLGSNPDLIHPGTTIDLPGADSNLVAQGGTYIVKPGDSLWKISQELLGDGTKWGSLYQANMSVIGGDPRLILPGQQLTIPGMDGASQTLAQTPAAQAGQQVAQTTQQQAQVPQTEVVQQPSVDAQAEVQPVEPAPQTMPEQPAPGVDATNPAQPSPGPGAAHGTPISAQPVQYTPQAPVVPASPQNAPVVSSSLVPNDVLSFLRKNK